MASNTYQINTTASTSGEGNNPFIKVIEQEFMHAIDKAAVPPHVLTESAPQENEESNEVSDAGSDMEEVLDDGSFSELTNQNTNWPHRAVLLLIDLYRKHLPKFNSKNIKKKGVWNLLAQDMKKKGCDVNGEACDKKFRALKHRYKVILESINTTGRRNRKWEYFELMGKLLDEDPAFKASVSSANDVPSSPSDTLSNFSDSNEEEEDEVPDEDMASKNHVIWTHSRKLMLLKFCRDHRHDPQTSDVWKTVSDELKKKGCDISPDVCEKKFRYFKYRYKKIMESDDPIREGNKWVYFEIMKSLLEEDSIFRHKSSAAAAATISIPPFKIVNSNPDDIVSKSLIKSFKQERLEEANENAHDENEDMDNGNEGRGDYTYIMEELEEAQDEDLSGAYVPTVWSHRAILLLIKLYKVHLPYFKSPSIKKSEIWKMISTKMESTGHNYSAEACDKKFRCLKYRYSKILEDGSSNGRGKKWQYFQAMQSLLENDPEYEPIKIVSTMALPPDEIEDHSSSTSAYGLRRSKRSPAAVSTFKVRGASSPPPPPRKRLRTSIYDEPPSWFLAFVESQNKHMEEVKALQRAAMKVAKERNAILRSFTDILLKKMKTNK